MHSSSINFLLGFLLISLSPNAIFCQVANDVLTNAITKDSSSAAAQATSSSSSQATAGAQQPLQPNPGGPIQPQPPHHPQPPPPPPIIPGFGGFGGGAGAGAGFHKSIDFNAGAGAGLGPLLAGLMPGYAGGFGAQPPVAPLPPPPIGGDIPEVPPPVGLGDPLLGGGPGYMGFPGFLGPSYVPYSWLGSALGAKGDLLFPIVIFVFVVVGIWTVVQFLLGLIVPLIAGKLAIGQGLLAAKTHGKFLRSAPEDPMEEHHEKVLETTHQVHAALDATQQKINATKATNNATHFLRGIF